MKIGILKEITSSEKRVAIIPEIIKKLISQNHEVFIESGAGKGSFISDQQYKESGAVITAANEIYNADVIFKINPPAKEELEHIKHTGTIFTFFQIKLTNFIINILLTY